MILPPCSAVYSMLLGFRCAYAEGALWLGHFLESRVAVANATWTIPEEAGVLRDGWKSIWKGK